MRPVLAVLVAAALWAPLASSPAAAQAKPPITVAQGLSMLAGLRNLDGRMVVVKPANGGADQTIMLPWEFGSGTLRIKIAKNIAILADNERNAEVARQGIIKELLAKADPDKDGRPATSIQPGTPAFDSYLAQYQQALDSLAAGSGDLMRFKASELKLERNEIPVTALAAMAPILDLD